MAGSSGGIASAVEGAFKRNRRIDVIVSNVGYGPFGAAEELVIEEIDRQIATNLTRSIHLLRAALSHLRRHGGGRIVHVLSEGGQIACPGGNLVHAAPMDAYVATPAAAVRQAIAEGTKIRVEWQRVK